MNNDTRILSAKGLSAGRMSLAELEHRCRELGIDIREGDETAQPQAKAVRPIRIASFEC
jgi:hypothetical protein